MVISARRKNELTKEEFRDLMASRIRQQLNMSLDEFMERRMNNDLPDVPGCAELDVLAGERTRTDTQGR